MANNEQKPEAPASNTTSAETAATPKPASTPTPSANPQQGGGRGPLIFIIVVIVAIIAAAAAGAFFLLNQEDDNDANDAETEQQTEDDSDSEDTNGEETANGDQADAVAFVEELQRISEEFGETTASFDAFDTAETPDELVNALDEGVEAFENFKDELNNLPEANGSDEVVEVYENFLDQFIDLFGELKDIVEDADSLEDAEADITDLQGRIQEISMGGGMELSDALLNFIEENDIEDEFDQFGEDTTSSLTDDENETSETPTGLNDTDSFDLDSLSETDLEGLDELYSDPAIQDLVNRYISGEITEDEYLDQFMDLYLNGEVDFNFEDFDLEDF